jgi:anti-sigma B factor antagonist
MTGSAAAGKGTVMELRQQELNNGVLKVTLSGSFDIAGAGDVDLPFSVIGGKWNRVIVDLGNVGVLASMGVRVLVKTAKAIGSRGGRMVVMTPSDAARRVLSITGVDAIIPVVDSEAEALEKLA